MKFLRMHALICCWRYTVGWREPAPKVQMVCFSLLLG